jgi:hypothetical protein
LEALIWKALMKRLQQDAWFKIIELAIMSFATWLNPNAALLLFLLRLCFRILEMLRQQNRNSIDPKNG